MKLKGIYKYFLSAIIILVFLFEVFIYVRLTQLIIQNNNPNYEYNAPIELNEKDSI